MKAMVRTGLAMIALSGASAAHAQPIAVADSGDSAWVLAGALIALLAIPAGLLQLYKRHHPADTSLSLIVASAGASLLYAAIGYSLAFGSGEPLLGDFGNVFLSNLEELRANTTVAESVFVVLQFAAAIFAMALLVSALASRARAAWLMLFVPLWLVLVFVPVQHWVWGGGQLLAMGTIDSAGGLVVQLCASVSALAASFLLTKRSDGDAVAPAVPTGALALVWFGWMAFAGATTVGAGDAAASAALNIHLAASAAVVAGLLLGRIGGQSLNLSGIAISALAGMAAASAGAANIGAPAAIILGVIGVVVAKLVGGTLAKLGRGDAPGVFATHGASAAAGALVFPLLVLPQLGGPGYDEGFSVAHLFQAQAIAVLAVTAWSVIATVIVATIASTVSPMRDTAKAD